MEIITLIIVIYLTTGLKPMKLMKHMYSTMCNGTEMLRRSWSGGI